MPIPALPIDWTGGVASPTQPKDFSRRSRSVSVSRCKSSAEGRATILICAEAEEAVERNHDLASAGWSLAACQRVGWSGYAGLRGWVLGCSVTTMSMR